MMNKYRKAQSCKSVSMEDKALYMRVRSKRFVFPKMVRGTKRMVQIAHMTFCFKLFPESFE